MKMTSSNFPENTPILNTPFEIISPLVQHYQLCLHLGDVVSLPSYLLVVVIIFLPIWTVTPSPTSTFTCYTPVCIIVHYLYRNVLLVLYPDLLTDLYPDLLPDLHTDFAGCLAQEFIF